MHLRQKDVDHARARHAVRVVDGQTRPATERQLCTHCSRHCCPAVVPNPLLCQSSGLSAVTTRDETRTGWELGVVHRARGAEQGAVGTPSGRDEEGHVPRAVDG